MFLVKSVAVLFYGYWYLLVWFQMWTYGHFDSLFLLIPTANMFERKMTKKTRKLDQKCSVFSLKLKIYFRVS